MNNQVDQLYKSLSLGGNSVLNVRGTLVEDALPFLEKYKLKDSAEKYASIISIDPNVSDITVTAMNLVDDFSLNIKAAAYKELLEIGRNDIIEKVKSDEIKTFGKISTDLFVAEKRARNVEIVKQIDSHKYENTSKNTLQIPAANEKPVIGKIKFLGVEGEVAETKCYTNSDEYLATIKKEIDYMDGFKAYTNPNYPELRKTVDDIFYSNCGAENPHSLEWYTAHRTIYNDESQNLKFEVNLTKDQLLEKTKANNSSLTQNIKSKAKEIPVVEKPTSHISQSLFEKPALPADFSIKKTYNNPSEYLEQFVRKGKFDFKNFEIFRSDNFYLTGDFKFISKNGNRIPKFDSLTLTNRVSHKQCDCMQMLNKLNENNVDILKLNPSHFEQLFSKNSLNLTDIKGKELFTKSLTDKPFNISITRVGGKMFGFTSKIMNAFTKLNEAVMG